MDLKKNTCSTLMKLKIDQQLKIHNTTRAREGEGMIKSSQKVKPKQTGKMTQRQGRGKQKHKELEHGKSEWKIKCWHFFVFLLLFVSHRCLLFTLAIVNLSMLTKETFPF